MDLLVAVAGPVVIVVALLVVALPAVRQRRTTGEPPPDQLGVEPVELSHRETWRSPLFPGEARPLVRRALEELGVTVREDGEVIVGVGESRRAFAGHVGIRYAVRVSNEPWGAGIAAELAGASSRRPKVGGEPSLREALKGAAARLGHQLRTSGVVAEQP